MAGAAGLGAASGALLFLADYPVHAWPLQAVALMPWLWALARHRTWRSALVSGLALGACYTIPLLVATRFPLLMALGLGGCAAALWVVLSLAAARVIAWRGPLGALGVASVAVVVEAASYYLIPIWGTAQSFVRVWSAAPWAIQFISLTGTLGLVFVVVAWQSLLVNAMARQRERRSHGAVLAGLLIVVGAYDAVAWTATPASTIRVGAVGWTHEGLSLGSATPNSVLVRDVILPLARQAAERGAKVIVTPETGFTVRGATRDTLLERLSAFARQRGVALAVGYYDSELDDNRLLWIDERGVMGETFRKTHLIPLIEDYRGGDGSRMTAHFGDVRFGGMICQDDNFTDLSRGYGRDGADVVAVPTNDWWEVKDYHLENSRMRPLESGYGIVRAATNGVSVIVSARGDELARHDAFAQGPGVIVADLPVYRRRSGYAYLGNWVAGVAVLLLAVGALRERSD